MPIRSCLRACHVTATIVAVVGMHGITQCAHAQERIHSLPVRRAGTLAELEVPLAPQPSWFRLHMPFAHQVAVYVQLSNADGQPLGHIFRNGFSTETTGEAIAPGGCSAWIDIAPLLDQAPDGRFVLRGLFWQGKEVSGWDVRVQLYAGPPPPPDESGPMLRLEWPAELNPNPDRYVKTPRPPFQRWIDATAIMQPWCGSFSEAMILDRQRWIPKLRDELGIGAVVFIPPEGDIAPNYPMHVYRDAVRDYHAAGLKVLMYWSIMHVGHHDAWHTVALEHPEWAQRDAASRPITHYGDKWLCPNTLALHYCIDLGVRLMLDMDADGIMLDNNGFGRTPEGGITCYCSDCGRHFAPSLKGSYPTALKHEISSTGVPKPGSRAYNVWREWRYNVWARANEQFRQAVRNAKPEAILCANTQYFGNWTLSAQGQYGSVDLIFSESRDKPGAVMSMKLLYAHALAQGSPVWNYLGTWVPEDVSRLLGPGIIEDAICTCLARGASPWLVGYGFITSSQRLGWKNAWYDCGKDNGDCSYDTASVYSGTSSARLQLKEHTARLSVYQHPFLQVTPGMRFRFSCAVKESQVEPGRARVRLTFVDDRHQAPSGQPYTFYVDASGGTHDWTIIERSSIVAPEGASLLNVEAFIWSATGTAWYDDMRLTKDGDDTNLLTNPGFELEQDAEQLMSMTAAKRCLSFGKQHRDLLRGLASYTNVALLASRYSTDYGGAPRIPFTTMRCLLLANIGFDAIGDEALTHEGLSAYDLLLFESASCLSDAALSTVADWVRAGGSLVFIGRTGQRDELGTPRGDDRLERALGLSAERLRDGSDLGKGYVRRLSGEADKRFETEGLSFLAELAQAVVDRGGGLVQITSEEPSLEVSSYVQPASRRLVFTLDNQGQAPEPSGVRLRFPIPKGWGDRVRLLSLDDSGAEPVAAPIPGGLQVDVPLVSRFAIMTVGE